MPVFFSQVHPGCATTFSEQESELELHKDFYLAAAGAAPVVDQLPVARYRLLPAERPLELASRNKLMTSAYYHILPVWKSFTGIRFPRLHSEKKFGQVAKS